MNYARVDQELAKYATAAGVEIAPEEDSRLKKMIERRVFIIMVITSFLQALVKGTLSFSSILHCVLDTHGLLRSSVRCSHLVRQSRERDALAATGIVEIEPTNTVQGFENLTKKANLRFRHMY